MGLLTLAFTAVMSSAQKSSLLVNASLTKFCDIARNPAAYNGKRVTFYAEFSSDHKEHSLLEGGDCLGMLPYVKDGALGAKTFDDASWVTPPATLKETLTATFTGTFHFAKKPEMCMFVNKEICRRSFEIDRIDDLKLTMTPIQ